MKFENKFKTKSLNDTSA